MALLGVTGLSSTTLAPAGAGVALEVAALATVCAGPALAAGVALATDYAAPALAAGAVPIASNGGLCGSDEKLMVFNVVISPESCDC
jgi:hypothetical protein